MSEKVPLFALVAKHQNLDLLTTFFDNLTSMGVILDYVPGESVDLMFIKVSIGLSDLIHYSELYEIGNEEINGTYLPYMTAPLFIFAMFPTPVSIIKPKKKGEFTNAESIMIVSKILETTKFDEDEGAYGMNNLIKRGILLDGYPLHDGAATETGLNDRSLMLRFWSRVVLLHKEQPLDLIKRYYGHEIAFYFAWLEYFNISLVIPSVLGVLVFIVSLIRVAFSDLDETKEICNNKDTFMCPVCERLRSNCEFVPLSHFCLLSHWTYIFDNYLTVTFAVLMSFVATLFLVIWRRKENFLKLKWNVDIDVSYTEATIRPVYMARVKTKKINNFTGELEPYTPVLEGIFRYSCSLIVCAIMIAVMLLFLVLNITTTIEFKHFIDRYGNTYLKDHKIIYSMIIGAFIQLFYIKFMSLFFGPLTLKLTNFENPRTFADYENSLIYKRFILAFINNLMPLFYLAFAKGRLYTVPHDNTHYFTQDVCQPQSCIIPLCIQLTFLLTVRSFAGNLGTFLWPRIKSLFRIVFRLKEKGIQELPQWEKDYFLQSTGKYFLTSEYSEMMVKYALVTFFAAAFPLGSFFALINNLIEMRSDAYKLVKYHRRPIPVKTGSIGTWNGILLIMTHFSVATNAFVLAFTSDFIPNQLHRHSEIKGYYNFILSKYASKDNPYFQKLKDHKEYCFFRGLYSPPDDPHPYQRNDLYWRVFTARFIAVFVFEHLVFLCNVILSAVIPKVPHTVRQELYLNKKSEDKEKIIKSLGKSLIKKREKLPEVVKIDMSYN